MKSEDSRSKLRELLRGNQEVSRALAQYLQEQLTRALSDAGGADDMCTVRRAQGRVSALKSMQTQLLADVKTAE